jgi:hypothetical protein
MPKRFASPIQVGESGRKPLVSRQDNAERRRSTTSTGKPLLPLEAVLNPDRIFTAPGRCAYSAESGHLDRRKLDSQSAGNWTLKA